MSAAVSTKQTSSPDRSPNRFRPPRPAGAPPSGYGQPPAGQYGGPPPDRQPLHSGALPQASHPPQQQQQYPPPGAYGQPPQQQHQQYPPYGQPPPYYPLPGSGAPHYPPPVGQPPYYGGPPPGGAPYGAGPPPGGEGCPPPGGYGGQPPQSGPQGSGGQGGQQQPPPKRRFREFKEGAPSGGPGPQVLSKTQTEPKFSATCSLQGDLLLLGAHTLAWQGWPKRAAWAENAQQIALLPVLMLATCGAADRCPLGSLPLPLCCR